MSSVSKRKHKTLTLREKMDVLQRLEKKESPSQLAKEYGVGRATLHDIKKKKLKIIEHFETMESVEGKRKTLKGGDYPEMETVLFKWFLKERAKHKTISGEILKTKAREFYKKIMKKDDFQASAGWLDKFKKRYGIRLLSTTFSTSIYAVQGLIQDKIDELGLTPDQVYNANDGGLFWQELPKKTSATTEENALKVSKERITFMLCANASGKNKFDLMLVGPSENTTASKDVCLPLYYKNQYNAYITRDVLTKWFNEEFIPGVKEFMRTSNKPEKALLILHDASGQLKAEDLKSSDGNIQTIILPSNCNPSLQPMCHLIQMVKTNYKKKLILNLIAQDGDISQSLKEVNMKNILTALADSWNSISAAKIRSSWEKLWPSITANNEVKGEEDEKAHNEQKEDEEIPIAAWLKLLAKKKFKINHRQLTAWFETNDDETEQLMADEEMFSEDMVEVVMEEEGVEGPSQGEPSVNSEEASQCFSKCITWAEDNGVSRQEITVLRKLREKALKQGLASKK